MKPRKKIKRAVVIIKKTKLVKKTNLDMDKSPTIEDTMDKSPTIEDIMDKSSTIEDTMDNIDEFYLKEKEECGAKGAETMPVKFADELPASSETVDDIHQDHNKENIVHIKQEEGIKTEIVLQRMAGSIV